MAIAQKTKGDLICLSGKTYDARKFSGVVIGGVWFGADTLPAGVAGRVARALESSEITDAPVDVVPNDDGIDFYYSLAG